MRLNKFLAEAGIASRRKADEIIANGQVQVNGKKVYELGIKINPEQDRITVNGKPIKRTSVDVYIMFHKPLNVLSAMSDPLGRPTVGDFFNKFRSRVFPVGRLDWDSEGLLLVTNNGEFANEVSHPKHEITKTYLVKVDGQLTEEQMQKLRNGVSILGGKAKALAIRKFARKESKYDWLRIVIAEGRNRQIRKMFEKLGFDVLKLQRIAIGQLQIAALPKGHHRELSPKDLDKIFKPDHETLDAKHRTSGKTKNPRPLKTRVRR